MRDIRINDIVMGGTAPLVIIAGPCVIESEAKTRDIAAYLKDLTARLDMPLVFKASYDKANRTSLDGYRGPGLTEGLRILKAIKADYGIPVLSDVHRFAEIDAAAEVLDVMQVPAFLCRQTDFVMEIARRARVVNIKKGQFLAPWDVANIVAKVEAAGQKNIILTERGVSFGYNNLVADFRSLPIMRDLGYAVVFDATHSVQLPGGAGTASGGQRQMVPYLSRAAAAVGVDGLFLEVHPDPDCALCDGPNSVRLDNLEENLKVIKEIDGIAKRQLSGTV